MRELDIQETATFPALPFALNAQLKNEIFLGGTSPSKFTEQNFRSAAVSARDAVHSFFRIEAKTGNA
ncbi:MAG: hypothetical protein PHH36_01265 [Sideroxydans sp.]|nr:hypothetical protein [Sideroxydans sp.]